VNNGDGIPESVRRARREDRERRQVRTQSGGPVRARRRPAAKRRTRKRSRLPRFRLGGPGTMLWGSISLVLSIVAVVLQGAVWIVAAGVSLGVTAGVAHIERRTASAGSRRRPSKQSNPRGSRSNPRATTSSGPKARGGGSGNVCGEACKRSNRPKSTCRCTSPECAHGSLAGLGAIIPGAGGSSGGQGKRKRTTGATPPRSTAPRAPGPAVGRAAPSGGATAHQVPDPAREAAADTMAKIRADVRKADQQRAAREQAERDAMPDDNMRTYAKRAAAQNRDQAASADAWKQPKAETHYAFRNHLRDHPDCAGKGFNARTNRDTGDQTATCSGCGTRLR
jgi:hypothetical protein